MDSEEIAKLVRNLKLSQSKDKAHVVSSSDLATLGRQRLEACLIGKVFSSKAVNREAFRNNMPRILQAKKSIAIEMVGDNLFSLDFNSLIEKNRALFDGPWNYFKDLVIFEEPRGLQNPNDIAFTEVPLWVQLHNLPIAFMHPTILRKLGEQLGRVLEVESGEKGKCAGKFVRLRIMKNIADPLEKGLCVCLADTMEESCILILYEKLPNFCYACGRLGHLLRDCEDVTVDKNSPEFGCWMRAPAAPTAKRGGNLGYRNSDSNGPSRLRGVSESPSDSNPSNDNTTMEDIILNADELDQNLGGVDVVAPISEVMLACPKHLSIKKHNVSLESGSKPIPPHQVLMGDLVGYSEVNSIKLEKKKEQLTEKVLSVIHNKGKKQWKRLARGENPNLKSRETKVSEEGDGKRLREQVDQISEGSKKFKHDQEPCITFDAAASAEYYELFRLECSWAWEPTSIPRAQAPCSQK